MHYTAVSLFARHYVLSFRLTTIEGGVRRRRYHHLFVQSTNAFLFFIVQPITIMAFIEAHAVMALEMCLCIVYQVLLRLGWLHYRACRAVISAGLVIRTFYYHVRADRRRRMCDLGFESSSEEEDEVAKPIRFQTSGRWLAKHAQYFLLDPETDDEGEIDI